jgi:hypothetical protein
VNRSKYLAMKTRKKSLCVRTKIPAQHFIQIRREKSYQKYSRWSTSKCTLGQFVPWAFFATLSRNNNTMTLETCDMSPARRKIFIMLTLFGFYKKAMCKSDPLLKSRVVLLSGKFISHNKLYNSEILFVPLFLVSREKVAHFWATFSVV